MFKELLDFLRVSPALKRARGLRGSDATGAEAAYRSVLERAPGNADARRELSDLLCARGDTREALRLADEALRLRPGWADAHNSAGTALYAQGRLDDAITHYRQALAVEPAFASAHLNLGNALIDRGDMDAALAAYRRAATLAPADATMHLALAIALEDDGRYEEALAAYRRALELAPSDGLRIRVATLLPMYPDSSRHIDELRAAMEDGIDRLLAQPLRLEDPAREIGQTAFLLAYQGRNDRALLTKLAALYERACPALLYTAPHCLAPRPRGRKLRVGFASCYFTAHSVGIWYNRLIALLAATREFEVVLVDLGGAADAELRAACARVITPPRDLARAREAIAAAELDVLVHADIGMDPFGYFLAFSRLAPVQCTTFGHPVTSGLRNIDYFLSSSLFEPADAQEHYRERLALLNALPLYISRPLTPAQAKSRTQLGLPDDRRLYVCPMMLHKFHPDFDAAMAAILRRDPLAEIVLFRDGKFPRRHEGLQRRFAAAYPDVAPRLRFQRWAPLEDLMSIIQLADVVIDTFHFSAGTTAFLVFAFGAPLVTLPGDYARGRPTLGCYRKMGMTDCVAKDAADYVELAVRIANDKELRAALGRKILASCGTLYSDPAVVEELAAFLRTAASSAATRATTGDQSA